MSDLQKYYIEYIRRYIELLTKGREEFFLSLCDIEEEILLETDSEAFSGYHVVIIDRKDYSEAVRLRNDTNVSRIVLLSGEGVRQIDSLKDFNEYSVLPEGREKIWNCLERVFRVELEPKVRVFLGAIMEQNEISLGELIRYIQKSLDRGKIVPVKLNRNLPMLGIWKSDDREILGKGKIKKLIRASKYSVVESRLTKAVTDRKIDDQKKVRTIKNGLAKGDMQKILETFYYKDVEQYLKSVPREKPLGMQEESAAEESVFYSCSYEYKLRENVEEDINKIERRWLKERQDEEAETDIDWNRYLIGEEEAKYCGKQWEELIKKVADANLSLEKRRNIRTWLDTFYGLFKEAWPDIQNITPVCLDSFCGAVYEYAQEYFALLSRLMFDESLRGNGTGALKEIIEDILLLFCEKKEEKISMPFYHPMSVFYYMELWEVYEDILNRPEEEETAFWKRQFWLGLAEKVRMQFPVEFLTKGNNRYVLDNTTVGKSKLVFTNAKHGAVYSVLDFRVVQKQILKYILRHPYMTEITICLLDISELTGLVQLIDRIHRYAETDLINIGRLDFLIISEKEEELKQSLSGMWEAVGMDAMVRFRFSRQDYLSDSGYDLECMIEESDLLIMGDNAMLYSSPQLVQSRADNNSSRNRLKEFDLSEQSGRYYICGNSDMGVMWGTLQKMAADGQEGFYQWRSRKLEDSMLTYINRKVSENPQKTIVVLSSNEHILSEIFRTEYIHAYRKKYNGKSISLIEFDQRNKNGSMLAEGKPEIRCSLMELYSDSVGEEVVEEVFPGITDIELRISYKNGGVNCKCLINGEEEEELGYDWQKRCLSWLSWQMGELLKERNILTDYFRALWLDHLQEGAKNLPSVLLAEKLCRENAVEFSFGRKRANYPAYSEHKEPDDCIEAMKLHELLCFLNGKAVIDERTIKEFMERYEPEILEKLLHCSAAELLDKKERSHMQKLQEGIRGK